MLIRTNLKKDFNQNKNLIVLRSCNELLRRLSRAEDAVFCGRVFIFLFQSFPLGDKSSVNLRGEFHVENVTTFEEPAEAPETGADEQVERAAAESETKDKAQVGESRDQQAERSNDNNDQKSTKATETGIITPQASKAYGDRVDTEGLYPIFWTLQRAFSNPLRLFSRDFFGELKTGLDMTIGAFKKVPKVPQTKQDDSKRGTKRRHGEGHDQFANNFNPKYLTSRDLFKLEVGQRQRCRVRS